MKFAFIFGCLGGALLWLGLSEGQGRTLTRAVCLSAGAAFFGIALSYQLAWPGLLGKTRHGRLLPSSYVLFWPYHALSRFSLLAFRLCGREALCHEILPGLFLGGRPFAWEERKLHPLGLRSVLDLTSEFSETRFLRGVETYRCIPVLDNSAPSPAELELAVGFIRDRLTKGPVYVHCALGHGRSATVVVGYLLATQAHSSLEEALALVRSKRRGVRLTGPQTKLLQHTLHERRNL
jgi:hypothetical protein